MAHKGRNALIANSALTFFMFHTYLKVLMLAIFQNTKGVAQNIANIKPFTNSLIINYIILEGKLSACQSMHFTSSEHAFYTLRALLLT